MNPKRITAAELKRCQTRLNLIRQQRDGIQFELGRLFEKEQRHRTKLKAIHDHQSQLTEAQQKLRSEATQIEGRLLGVKGRA